MYTPKRYASAYRIFVICLAFLITCGIISCFDKGLTTQEARGLVTSDGEILPWEPK